MPFIIGLAAGIVLMTAGTSHHWFDGAHTVGLILTIVSAVVIVGSLALSLVVGKITKKIWKTGARELGRELRKNKIERG